MAGRNNPLIKWLNISFDTFNLLHRWLGRIVILEAVAHTLAFWAGASTEGGWAAAVGITFQVRYMVFGFIVSLTVPVVLNQQANVATRGNMCFRAHWHPS